MAAEKNSNQGHRKRLREKFLQSGLLGFHDYEIIELLLTLGTPRKDCKEAAKQALQKFTTLREVLEAEAHELQEIKGIGPHNIFGLKLVQEVARRFLADKLMEKPFCRSAQAVFDYLYHTLRDKKREVFKVIYLDAQSRILGMEDLFTGSLTASSIYPREIVERALRNKAAALIFVHNHPSGAPKPSQQDLIVTRELVFAARLVEIRVFDHVIIGEDNYYSFADQGVIQSFEAELKKIKQIPAWYRSEGK